MTIELTPGGLLIAIEGIDGAGKTTLARSLATLLEQAGARVVLSKEPTNGPWGTQLRQSAATGRLSAQDEVDLLLRDRREHVETLIAPALARGEIVILDRYFPSMVAYQGAAGLPLDTLLAANDFAPRPDLLLLLDLPPPTGLARIRARGDAPNHFETQDNLERCRAIFAALQLPGKHVIDASADADSVLRQAHALVVAALADRLRVGATHTDAEKAALELLSAGRPT
ncbi:dTMP kinase [Xanthomonas campestris]|uniref:dTMP kinase n=1 Tax=Xanthomonas campestris TaxID=339 RepID=UPI00096F94EA|nr:dTMP kinase [Xanthomonas campestris]MCF8828225.1 dTMP kinase [Xanthomonas campestris pv. raphani]MEA9841337.1 dTMP kinase [Xanthomonas campestris pv. raphani]MEA9933200.1 dTMP kinase [Xanthomonas campestris pv. raphani]QLC71519.1 dTMP kinase [Xanthomonas campestris pv. raphani]WDJ18460.1 dTMP kinase [Xanthomonas campestris pv. raphani]